MIRVHRPEKPPAILAKRGAEATQALCDASDRGEAKLRFDSTIYGAKSVKNALRKAQHEKCCFCESKVSHVAHGDVEHFRPKAGFRQDAGDPLGMPGYYWLAYEWTNLLFCCQICNQRHKKNHFPLADAARRATSHRDDLRDEEPLFIDPAAVDPALHIGFREEYAYAIDDSPRGRATIEALGLNRELLVEERRKILRLLLKLHFPGLHARRGLTLSG